MRTTRVVAAIGALAVAAVAAPAQAADIVVVSEVLPGTRAISSIGLPDLLDGDTTLDFSGIGTQTTAKLTISPVVDEVNAAAPAGGDWSVKLRVCGPANVDLANSLPSGGSDCANKPDQIVKLTDVAVPLDGSAFNISDRSVLQVLGGGAAAAVAGTENLDVERTIFDVTGQNAGPYSGTYTGSADVSLTVPSAQGTGTYVGYVVVTLVE